MTVIKTTDSIDELNSVIEQLDCDIGKWRSKDTGGSNGKVFLTRLYSTTKLRNKESNYCGLILIKLVF